MPQANIEMLRRAYEALNREEWESVFRAMHPDLELKAPDRMMRSGTYRGRESVRQFFEDLLEPFEDVVAEPEKFFQSGDRIVVFLLLRSRPTGGSVPLEIRIGHLWTMHDGKGMRLEIFPEREKALETLGLSEQDAHADS